MITLVIQGHTFSYEMEHIVRMFYPGEDVRVAAAYEEANSRCILTSVDEGEDKIQLVARISMEGYQREEQQKLAADTALQQQERSLAVLLFRLLSKKEGKCPPWGILTGVRPVRLIHNQMERGADRKEIFRHFSEDWLVSDSKISLAFSTALREKHILEKNASKSFSLYVGIPFCPTRCLYCSFVSHAIDKTLRLLPDYVRLLCEEIQLIGEIAMECNLSLHTVYIGGGTPTVLDTDSMTRVLQTVRDNFEFDNLLEYTMEAGRPDTITADKLELMRSYDVDRISINPQTLNQEILHNIGRKHTTEQFFSGFRLARQAGFPVINTDLIAGLPGEDSQSFLHGLEQILNIRPENITVHTLTVKRSSSLRELPDAYREDGTDLSVLLDQAGDRLNQAGYGPYYLYRQKGTRQNLENTGYSLPGCDSPYNVYIMEEVHTVLSAGAGAVTKLCGRDGEIQRVFNFKFPYEYINRFDELLLRKSEIRSFYERYY